MSVREIGIRLRPTTHDTTLRCARVEYCHSRDSRQKEARGTKLIQGCLLCCARVSLERGTMLHRHYIRRNCCSRSKFAAGATIKERRRIHYGMHRGELEIDLAISIKFSSTNNRVIWYDIKIISLFLYHERDLFHIVLNNLYFFVLINFMLLYL